MLTRRLVLTGTAVAAAGALGPRLVLAEVAAGGGRLMTLSDGNLELPADFYFGGLDAAELAPILAEFGIGAGPVSAPCNLTLYRDGANTVLFDAGAGTAFMASAGRLPESLAAAGVAPDEITHVILTHAHADHLWGLLDDFDELAFPEAVHMIGRAEWDYWTDPNTVNTIGPDRQAMAVGAARRLTAVADRVVLFGDGDEVAPGIAALATPGHTPGHMSFEIAGSGGETVIVVGDALSNHHVAFARPGWPAGNDQDRELAAATRLRLLGRLAAEQLAFTCFHAPGGFGRAEPAGESYRFVALDQ